MEIIPHSRPWITEADKEAVTMVLTSLMLGQGERVRQLEQRLASWLNATDGVAVGSGSAAIMLALRGLNVGPGDEVILPTYVCRSILQAVHAVGSIPILCDVGPNWVITPFEAARVVSSRTRAIVTPHLYGIFVDVEEFRPLGIPIIEDCAQAIDGEGICTQKSDISVLSFHPTKCLTAGEGGMALTSNTEILARMRDCRDGKDSSDSKKHLPRLFSPMSDIAAGLALSQLGRYEQGLARRREISTSYLEVIDACCPDALGALPRDRTMYFRFPLHIAGGPALCQKAFANYGVTVRKGVDELLHRQEGLPDTEFPNAVRHFETTVSLPIYPSLTHSEQLRCIDAVAHVLPSLQDSSGINQRSNNYL